MVGEWTNEPCSAVDEVVNHLWVLTPGGAIQGGDVEWVRGGKFSRLKGGGGVTTRRGVCEGDRGSATNSLRDREEDKAIVSTSLINSSSPLVRSPTEVGKDES